jgi:hypothetical protein
MDELALAGCFGKKTARSETPNRTCFTHQAARKPSLVIQDSLVEFSFYFPYPIGAICGVFKVPVAIPFRHVEGLRFAVIVHYRDMVTRLFGCIYGVEIKTKNFPVGFQSFRKG